MKETASNWIGVDPGGKGNFGVAVLNGRRLITRCVDYADAAIQFVVQNISSIPSGVEIDAPLWWSSGRSSDREADRWIRRTYGLRGENVQAANSLRGAALVQGVMFAARIRERFPGVPITESHPNALRTALKFQTWEAFCDEYSIKVHLIREREHERDAVLAALSAREGFEGRWRRDLTSDRLPSEQDPATYWLAPVHYYWPSYPQ